MSHTTCDCTQAARDAETDIWPNPSAGQLLAAVIAKAADGMGLTSSLLARPGPSEPADASEALRDVPPAERPSEALPRPIDPEDVRVGMVVEQRKGEGLLRDRVVAIEDGTIKGEVAWFRTEDERFGWSLWLVEDAPEPVDPDAAVIEAIITAYRRSPECSTHAVFGESMLDHLRAQGFDVTARAEQ